MTIRRFVFTVLVLAALIVAAVGLSRRGSEPGPASGDPQAPVHSFFTETDRSGENIACPVATQGEPSDIWSNEVSLCWLKSGWSQPQPWGSLAMGSASVFEIEIEEVQRRILLARLRAEPELSGSDEQSVKVYVNNHLLDERKVTPNWRRLRFPIPPKALRVGTNTFSLVFENGNSPRLAGTGKSHRRRAARVSELTLANPLDGVETPAKKHTADIWDTERQSLLIKEAGTIVLPIYIPSGTPSIEFDLRATIGAVSSKIITTVVLEELDGVSTHRSEIAFRAGKSYTAVRIPISNKHGRWALLTASSTITSGSIAISNIRFTPSIAVETSKNMATTADGQIEQRPNIIWITLDAARADRFSFAGNPNETTPFIDSLAEESLVFPSAFSLVPYTLCSVPTMITGLSFLDHGVIKHEDVLHTEAVTLAETLHEAGYQTAAFTQTPNNSSSKGFDQGYEVFREMWTEGERGETRRASFIARKVVDWLESGARDQRPLHLQVHIVPPHAPYDPPPEFDIFTDPNYDGSCVGFQRTLDGLDSGFMEPDQECLDQLFSLYDGNLLAADHAVRTIIEALRTRPRWNNTVILITSDHGEAFMEHGRMEHNSTLYTEMLHVPFVLRMPPGHDGSSVDTGRMVTVADIRPTLLSAAGLTPGRSADSVDLLAPDLTPGSRFIVSRTATSPTLHGIRTPRWNLLVSAAGSATFFDLEADPGEHTNGRLKNRAQYIGLGRILSTRLAMPARLAVADQTADITEDEKDLLEALGYIRD